MSSSDELRAVAERPLRGPPLPNMVEDVHAAPPSPPAVAVPPTPPEDDDRVLRRYPIRVRQLLEARTARFAIARATLIDLGEAGTGGGHADLLLDFGDHSFGNYGFGNYGFGDYGFRGAELLGLRFVFAHTEEAETFTTADGTLLGTVSPAKDCLLFKLRLSEHWRGARHALWSRLECCVLFHDD